MKYIKSYILFVIMGFAVAGCTIDDLNVYRFWHKSTFFIYNSCTAPRVISGFFIYKSGTQLRGDVSNWAALIATHHSRTS